MPKVLTSKTFSVRRNYDNTGDTRYLLGNKPNPGGGALSLLTFNTPTSGYVGGQPQYQGGFLLDVNTFGASDMKFTQRQKVWRGTSDSKIFVTGHSTNNQINHIAEFNIPALSTSTNINDLNVGTNAQQYIDLSSAPSIISAPVITGGYYDSASNTIICGGEIHYDGGVDTETRNVWVVRGATNLASASVEGMVALDGKVKSGGTTWPIPAAYQSQFGGSTHMIGNSVNGPNTQRRSTGPAAYAFSLSNLIVEPTPETATATAAMVYPFGVASRIGSMGATPNAATDLATNVLWNHLTWGAAAIHIPGTKSVLWLGRGWDGVGTIDYVGGSLGYEPGNGGGYAHRYALFDLDDLVAAYAGSISPQDIFPYEYGDFAPNAFPFASDPGTNYITGMYPIQVSENVVDLYCSIILGANARFGNSTPSFAVFRLNVGGA